MNDKGKVLYLDLSDCEIKQKGPSKLGTEYGYYLKENERFLGDNIEGPFGKISSEVLNFIDNNSNFATSYEFEKQVKDFFAFSILRSDFTKIIVEQNSYSILPGSRTQDILVEYGQNFQTLQRQYSSFKLNFLYNTTDLGLVTLRIVGIPLRMILLYQLRRMPLSS
jgi:hypothetical protein